MTEGMAEGKRETMHATAKQMLKSGTLALEDIAKFLQWKKTHGKECLLVKGARQVGKTFIIDKFGRDNYSSYLYVNFITSPECRSLFDDNLDANEIVKRLCAIAG